MIRKPYIGQKVVLGFPVRERSNGFHKAAAEVVKITDSGVRVKLESDRTFLDVGFVNLFPATPRQDGLSILLLSIKKKVYRQIPLPFPHPFSGELLPSS